MRIFFYSARCSSELSLLAIKLEKLLAKDLPQVYTVFRSWKLMRGGTDQKCTLVLCMYRIME